MSNYSENILQAVDMVVTERLKGINFDKTIIGKVVKANDNGSYTISYEAMTLLAYPSDNEEYDEGSQVYVLIPQGDYNLRKIITGKVSAKEIANYLYINPGKQLVPIELYSGNNANGIDIKLRDFSNEDSELPTIKYLYFSADFQTTDVGKINQTEYGIQITGTGILKEPKEDKDQDELLGKLWQFTSSQFQGNPYMFNGWFKQEYLFDIEKYSEIKELKISYINQDNFSIQNIQLATGYAVDSAPSGMKTGKVILYEENSKEKYPQPEEEITTENNEFNLKTKFFLNNQLINDSTQYKYKWFVYNKTSADLGNGKHWGLLVTDENGTNEYSVSSLELKPNTSKFVNLGNDLISQITMPNIEEKFLQIAVQVYKTDKIMKKETDGTYTCLLNNPQDLYGKTDYKNVSEIYNQAVENANKLEDETEKTQALKEALNQYNEALCNIVAEEKIATSNILPLLRSDQADIEGALKGSGVELTAADDGTYFIYDGTTNLVNKELKKNKTFRITAKLTGAAKWTTGQTLRWKIPKKGTMIAAPDPTKYNAIDTEEPDPNKPLLLTDDEKWYIIEDTTAADTNPTLDFDISDIYDPAATMNVIRCEVGEGENQVGSGILLTFGISGSQGTEYTIGISFDKNYIVPNGQITATGHFYDPDGNEIEDTNFYWSLSQKPYDNNFLFLTNGQDEIVYKPVFLIIGKEIEQDKYFEKNANGEYTTTSDETVVENKQYYEKETVYSGTSVNINCIAINDVSKLDEYYATISLSLNYKDRNLYKDINFKTFKAIPVWAGDSDIEPEFIGPTTVVYNFQGTTPEFLKFQYSINNDRTDIELLGNKNTGFELGEDKKLIVPEMITTQLPQITVKLSAAAGGIWYQPLAIYRNEYTSAILNSWGGNQEIDEDGNKILTKMLGVGVKDDQNRFSGVFMGAVGKDITGSDTKTGLYGYQDGELRFKFTEDGEAYIGTGSDNRISFNEDKSEELEIRTKKFTVQSGTPDTSKYFYMSNDTPNNNKELVNIGNGAIKVKDNGMVEIGGDNRDWTKPVKYAVNNSLQSIPSEDKWYSSSTAFGENGTLSNWDSNYLYLWERIPQQQEDSYNYTQQISVNSKVLMQYSVNGESNWDDSQDVDADKYYRKVRQHTKTNAIDILEGPIQIPEGQEGASGQPGQGTFVSTVFKRKVNDNSDIPPDTPTDGSYLDPIPDGWSDGIPSGTGALWSSHRIFTSDGQDPQEDEWSAPIKMEDTHDLDVEYSTVDVSPGNPSTHPDKWTNTPSTNAIWMATRTSTNGVWGSWTVTRIKGEKGQDGAPGSNGTDGASVIASYKHYLLSTASTSSEIVGNNNVPNDLNSWNDDYNEVINDYLGKSNKSLYRIWSQDVTKYNNGTISYSIPTSRNADSIVGEWMKEEDAKVMINGASIAANSINVNSLLVNEEFKAVVLKGNDIITSINADKTGVSIKGEMLDLDGKEIKLNGTKGITITSPNFSVSSDGTITANQGKIATFDLKNGRIFGINQWMSDTVRVAYTSGMNARYHSDTDNKIFLWAGAIRKWDDPDETGDTWAYDTFGGPDGSYDWTNAYNCITTGFPKATHSTGPARFYVTHTGELHATEANISGTITADYGHIAGWTIAPHGLYNYNGKSGNFLNKYAGIWKYGSHKDSNNSDYIAISIGGHSGAIGVAPFRVCYDGHLYATNATITGTIEAGSVIAGGQLTAAQMNAIIKDTTSGKWYNINTKIEYLLNNKLIISDSSLPGILCQYTVPNLNTLGCSIITPMGVFTSLNIKGLTYDAQKNVLSANASSYDNRLTLHIYNDI